MTPLGNFSFLAQHSPLLSDLGQTAEKLYPFDPASCVLKLRLLAEALTQEMAARLGVHLTQPTQAELLRAVDNRLGLDPQVRQMFHLLRVRGNAAAHQVDHDIGYREGLEPNFRLDHSKTQAKRVYMNHCQHCAAKLGDHFMHCEPGGAFCPSSSNARDLLDQMKTTLLDQGEYKLKGTFGLLG